MITELRILPLPSLPSQTSGMRASQNQNRAGYVAHRVTASGCETLRDSERFTNELVGVQRIHSVAMAANPGRAAFRMLMRARASAFKGDTFALRESAQKLREEFLKNKDVSDAAAIGEFSHL